MMKYGWSFGWDVDCEMIWSGLNLGNRVNIAVIMSDYPRLFLFITSRPENSLLGFDHCHY